MLTSFSSLARSLLSAADCRLAAVAFDVGTGLASGPPRPLHTTTNSGARQARGLKETCMSQRTPLLLQPISTCPQLRCVVAQRTPPHLRIMQWAMANGAAPSGSLSSSCLASSSN